MNTTGRRLFEATNAAGINQPSTAQDLTNVPETSNYTPRNSQTDQMKTTAEKS